MFWLTEQKDTILPSLKSLDTTLPIQFRDEGDARAKRVLHNILSDPANVSLSAGPLPMLIIGLDAVKRER